jgi:hypothetical protein
MSYLSANVPPIAASKAGQSAFASVPIGALIYEWKGNTQAHASRRRQNTKPFCTGGAAHVLTISPTMMPRTSLKPTFLLNEETHDASIFP